MIIDTKDLNKCYGCFACANICPKDCIQLKQDEEGFFMPVVDRTSCIECGACDKVCIIDKTNMNLMYDHKKKPTCYYGYLREDKMRKQSASGGFSYALSLECIKENGIVFGVIGKWFEDVHHIKAESEQDLYQICGSKNIQSRVGATYKEVRKELSIGRKVFFTGTPCQIAGLYAYLGKDYPNLLTADLICHGVPSQKVLKAYISELELQKGKKIVKFGRDNTFQYLPVQYIAWYEDGTHEILMPENSMYRKGFLSNLFQRKSCYKCKFSKLPRIADLSMGDVMFTVQKPVNEIDPHNLGLSLVIVNSKKGEEALDKIKDSFEFGEINLELAIRGNRWVGHGIEKNSLRDRFFETFINDGFGATESVIEKSYNNMKKRYIFQGKIEILKILFNPIKLHRAIVKRIKR